MMRIPPRDLVRLGQFQQRGAHGLAVDPRRVFPELDADHRHLVASGPDADQGAAVDRGVGVENALTRDRVEGAAGGDDPMTLAAAEPDPAFLVHPAQVPHAVPHLAVSGYFRQGIGQGVFIIPRADEAAFDRDLADIPLGYLQAPPTTWGSARR